MIVKGALGDSGVLTDLHDRDIFVAVFFEQLDRTFLNVLSCIGVFFLGHMMAASFRTGRADKATGCIRNRGTMCLSTAFRRLP